MQLTSIFAGTERSSFCDGESHNAQGCERHNAQGGERHNYQGGKTPRIRDNEEANELVNKGRPDKTITFLTDK